MKQFFKNNWFKIIITVILLIITVEAFFALYPYAYEGYTAYRAIPPHKILYEQLFPGPASEIKVINRYKK